MIAEEQISEDLRTVLPQPGISDDPPRLRTGRVDTRRLLAMTMAGPVPVWRIQQKERHFRCRAPVMVQVRREGRFFFAESDALGITGTGITFEEAIRDLGHHIWHFYNYYRRLPANKVMGEAIRLRKLFSDLLIEEQDAG